MPTEPLESSQPLPTPGRYGSGAIAFHWIMFLLVVVVGILGLLHDDWSKATQPFWINVHAVIGLLLWFTLIARFGWRSRHAPPMLLSNVGAFARIRAAFLQPGALAQHRSRSIGRGPHRTVR